MEEELRGLFPGVEILRMDTDTVSVTHSHEAMLKKFQRERIPILLGTQMVAKGLDFENVTLVGVISADQSLYTGDIYSGERAFSLLTQVVGRAGRGGKEGQAVIQTFTPDNEVIRCAARQDYDAFYRQEIQIRELRNLRFRPGGDGGAPGMSEITGQSWSGPAQSALCRIRLPPPGARTCGSGKDK